MLIQYTAPEIGNEGLIPTEESHGFSPYLLWSGLRSGCRATKSRRSRSESAKLSGATGRSTWRLSTGLPANPPERRRAGISK
jgi:hypothetical protein